VAQETRLTARRGSLCVYCRLNAATTDDHVPPKNLFGKPRPNTLVTVPSCEACNLGASDDDEYFRNMLSLRFDANHPDAVAARASVMRSLARPQAAGLRTSLIHAMREIEMRTPAGLYLGRTAEYDVDVERLDRVVRRTSIGLFYRETGQALPLGYHAAAYLLPQVDPAASDAVTRLANIVNSLLAVPPKFIGPRTVSYRFRSTPEDPNASAWLLVFYERVPWLTITAPPDAARTS